MTNQLERCALITGASSGIGQATAIAFAQQGIHVALLGRNGSKLAETEAQTAQYGVKAKAYSVDLSKVQDVKTQIEAIATDFGTINILVNNAGMGYTNFLNDTPLTEWQCVLDLNLTSVFQTIQAVLPSMRRQHQGTIINVSSIAGHQAFPNWGAYCVSKFGLVALSKTLAQEERAHGIRVITISPGSVNTSLWDTETVDADFDRSRMLTPETVAQSILHAVLLPDQAVIEDLILMPNAGTF
jgi:NADP-dependent 3-hydroxy acid dehydrogenase YdfG